MAKELRRVMKPWIEVAPSLLDFPLKPSSTPTLETIAEERAGEADDDDNDNNINNKNDV
jgi:hypothetical protein